MPAFNTAVLQEGCLPVDCGVMCHDLSPLLCLIANCSCRCDQRGFCSSVVFDAGEEGAWLGQRRIASERAASFAPALPGAIPMIRFQTGGVRKPIGRPRAAQTPSTSPRL